MRKPLIPPEALENHIGFLGMTGAGKSNGAKVLAEGLMTARERVCIIDPTGSWWGLRLTPDGQPSSKFSPVIFGGDHGDIPISDQHGAVLGEAVGTSSDSCIIDTQQMTTAQRTRFFTAFAEALLRFNRGKLTLIIDEAHLFAPQGKVNDPQSGMMVGATNNMVSLGRSRGLRIILISQRPAKLHKDSLTQVATLIAMRLIAPQDRAAVKDWIGEWADPAKGAEIIASLPGLERGDAWCWAPQSGYLERIHFPIASTFDSGTAEANSSTRELAPIAIAQIGEKMDAIRQQAMENDPKRLRAVIDQLERERAHERAHPLIDATAIENARKAGYQAGYIKGTEDERQRLGQKVLSFAADFALLTVDEVQMPYVPPPENLLNKGVSGVGVVVGDGVELQSIAHPAPPSPSTVKLVDAIVAVYPRTLTLEAAAKRAGLSKRSSAFGRYIREARSSPRIQAVGVDGRYRAVAAEAGIQAPSGIADFIRALPPSYGRMLDAIAHSPLPLERSQIAEQANISPTSSGLLAGIKELRELGLIQPAMGGYTLHDDFR